MSTVNHQGKVAFIAGAKRGIGLEAARQLAGASLLAIIGKHSGPSGEAAVEQCCDEGLEGGRNGGLFHLGEALPW